MNLITVDMDPIVIENAKKFSEQANFENHQTIVSKGEDYLRNYTEAIDFIYLDAFDFWHNNHSEFRQQQYEKNMNCRIEKDNKLCHQMHLECCQHILGKLNDYSYICFDDILNESATLGKGVLAIPFLKESGVVKMLEYIPPSKETGQGSMIFGIKNRR